MRDVVLVLALLCGSAAAAMPPLPKDDSQASLDAFMKACSREDLPELRKAAEAGEPMAQLVLGILLLHTPKAEAHGVEWLRRAADTRSAHAAYLLGSAYALGIGVEPDEATSDRWLLAAAAQGHAEAQAAMGVDYVEKAEYAKALALLEPAARSGHHVAQRYLATLYTNGKGVKQDDAQAVEWGTRAAEAGDAEAMRLVGFILCCRIPSTISSDEVAAASWLMLAASAGDAKGRGMLEQFSATLSPAQLTKARRRAMSWLESHPDSGIAALDVPATLGATAPVEPTRAGTSRSPSSGSMPDVERVAELFDGIEEAASHSGARLSFVEVRRRKGGATEGELADKTIVTYHLVAAGLPPGHTYTAWMKVLGQPPARVATGFRVDAEGHLGCPPRPDGVAAADWCEMPLAAQDVGVTAALGEPKMAAVVSDDFTVRALAKVVPFPIERKEGPCSLSVEMEEPPGQAFRLSAAGFPPGSSVTVVDRSGDESVTLTRRVAPDGTFGATLLPAVLGASGGTASFRASADTCALTVSYEWGLLAFRWQ